MQKYCAFARERQKSCCFSKAVFQQSLITHFYASLAHCEKENTEVSFENLAQIHPEVSFKTPQFPLPEFLTTSLTESA